MPLNSTFQKKNFRFIQEKPRNKNKPRFFIFLFIKEKTHVSRSKTKIILTIINDFADRAS